MSRRRFVYRNGQAIELPNPADYPGTEVHTELMLDSHYNGLRATDGTDIGSRAKHRAYCKATGTTVADDYKGVWAKAAEERGRFFAGDFDHSGRREAVDRAIHELNRKR